MLSPTRSLGFFLRYIFSGHTSVILSSKPYGWLCLDPSVFFTVWKLETLFKVFFICVCEYGFVPVFKCILLSCITSRPHFPLPPLHPAPSSLVSSLPQLHSSSVSLQKREGLPVIATGPGIANYQTTRPKPPYQICLFVPLFLSKFCYAFDRYPHMALCNAPPDVCAFMSLYWPFL